VELRQFHLAHRFPRSIETPAPHRTSHLNPPVVDLIHDVAKPEKCSGHREGSECQPEPPNHLSDCVGDRLARRWQEPDRDDDDQDKQEDANGWFPSPAGKTERGSNPGRRSFGSEPRLPSLLSPNPEPVSGVREGERERQSEESGNNLTRQPKENGRGGRRRTAWNREDDEWTEDHRP